MFCAPELIFDGTDGVGSHFHVLRSSARFRRCGGRRVLFSCFAPPDSFSTVLRASGPVLIFCAPVLIFGGTEGGSRFNVLRAHTRFRLYRWRRFPFSCFALPDLFLVVPRASAPVFMFSTSRLVFGGTEGVGSRIHDLRSRTRFRGYRGSQVLFSCFALPASLSAVLWASIPVFMVLRARTRFRRYRRRRVPFSSFAFPDKFSAEWKASGPVFVFCAPRLVFDGSEGFRSRYHVLHARTHFRR
jgi:hypothetical protein